MWKLYRDLLMIGSLKDQLLGKAIIANYDDAAENRLKDLVLDGTTTKNWNFDQYQVEHNEQDMIHYKLKAYGQTGLRLPK